MTGNQCPMWERLDQYGAPEYEVRFQSREHLREELGSASSAALTMELRGTTYE